ncbi:MAG: glycosyltransferase [Planctomycetota bacterium]|nr:glycosyltransferase [Planctomycetota bacterium]
MAATVDADQRREVTPDPGQTPSLATLAQRLGRPPRVVLAHDWLCGYRGGEAVLDAIARVVQRQGGEVAAILTMFSDGRKLTPTLDSLPRVVSGVGKLPGASGKLRRWLLPLFPTAVGQLSRALADLHARQPIDLLVSVSSSAVKGIRTPPRASAGNTSGGVVPHLCYCLAPARYVWSQTDAYSSNNPLIGVGLKVMGGRFRRWDYATRNNVTRYVSLSRFIQAEVRRCFGRESTIVAPMGRTDFYTPDPGTTREDFWLIAGALEPYKRTDLAIQAANKRGARLVVVGAGSQMDKLRAMAGPSVSFTGRISDEALRDHYRRARLFLFPQVEDFGIVAIEAQGCGTPVVARRAGGALDTVLDGVSGSFFDDPTPDGLLGAIDRCPAADDPRIRANALRFSPEVFDREIETEIALACLTEPDERAALP